MDLGLAGRACAVTGASRGIGRETAIQLCAEGASVLLVARGADELEESAAACNGETATLALDVTEPDAGERVLAAATDAFGKLDALVNNAGTARQRDLDEVPDADWQAAWDLNVMAPLRLMRAATPAMADRGWGRVVNVSSSSGKRPSPRMPEYSVAKAAQLSLSRLYADRLAAKGVLVNAICPGPVKSELWMDEGGLLDQARAHGEHETRDDALRAAGSGRPIGRLGEVGEIASAIVFLASERASYVAGAAWSVDGGTVQVVI
jgi:3-oxoacyl-[acyl-carrier protein] reductase